MRADAYSTPTPTDITEEVLRMPIPRDPVSKLIPNDDNPAYRLESGSVLPSSFADPLPESDDEYDDLAAASQALTQPLTSNVEVTQASGGATRASGGVAPTSWGVAPASGGVTLASGGAGPGTGSPAGELRPMKRHRFSEAPPPYGVRPKKWWDCEETAISAVSDADLAEFLIGHSVNLEFPTDFWPNDHGRWSGEALDTVYDKLHFGNSLCLKVLLTSGPKSRKFGEHATIPISHSPARGQVNVSIRRTIADNFPHAVQCKDLTLTGQDKVVGKAKPKVVSKPRRSTRHNQPLTGGVALHAAPITFTTASKLRQSPEKCKMPAFYAFATSMMLQANQANNGFLAATEMVEPKN
eukprot:109247-Rhodomonas_salina.3